MVKSNRYTPTNKAFRNKFQEFASTKTKKGHLNGSDDKEGAKKLNGTLKKIDREKIYDKGWLVETTDGKEYWCSYGDGVVCIPESVVSEKYFVPKKTTAVEISVDEDNSIYTITRLKDPDKKPIALYNDTIEISTNTNTNSNKDVEAKVSISKNDIQLVGDTIADAFSADKITVSTSIKSDTTTSNTVDASTVKTEQLYVNDENISSRLENVDNEIKEAKETITTEATKTEQLYSTNEEIISRIETLERKINELEGDS